MTSLRPSPPWSRTFAWILAGSASVAAGGCIFSSPGSCEDGVGDPQDIELRQTIFADELREALDDGKIDPSECDYICASSYADASNCELTYDEDKLNGTSSAGGAGGASNDGGASSEGGAGGDDGAGEPAEWITVSCSFTGYSLCDVR